MFQVLINLHGRGFFLISVLDKHVSALILSCESLSQRLFPRLMLLSMVVDRRILVRGDHRANNLSVTKGMMCKRGKKNQV